jgi:trehalose/maltose hydrolase-like predicted phosphorylase
MRVVGRTAEPGPRGALLTMASVPEGRGTRLAQVAEVAWPAGLGRPSTRLLARGDTALSSGGYYGHIFWDSDTWMFPPLLLIHPEVARSLVAFRGRTLPGARENARANGHRGAMYPWEADERGRETTPRFAVQNARSEIHVTRDVALAQWQYWLATGDSVWLAREGYPVIRETADFWVGRATRDSAGGYHIEDVVSLSEGLIGVTDHAYTNAVARGNLEIAGRASRELGLPEDPWAAVFICPTIP